MGTNTYNEFVSLVKQLREAEKEEACLPSHAYDDALRRKREGLQREIDKRIKELENAQAL